MAKPKAAAAAAAGEADEVQIGRLRKLTVSNFKAIGPDPVEIDLDRIVVLVGPNNAGKSAILRAYELIMSLGKGAEIPQEEFHNENFDSANPPTFELISEVTAANEKWIINEGDKKLIKERWQYNGNKLVRSGWNAKDGVWDDKKPFGFDSVANKQRPEPHYIKAFDSPETQAEEINKIVLDLIREKAKAVPDEDGVPGGALRRITEAFVKFQEQVLAESSADVAKLETDVASLIAKVFTGHRVKLDISTKPKRDMQLFDGAHSFRIGPTDGHMAPMQHQGSGTRRTALWSVLSVVAARKSGGTRPHLLLLDEPEMCLHPNAIRQASEVLYDLASTAGWQVMITTHSPVFIDLSRDNKTVVRVERQVTGKVSSTTLFRPEQAKLDESDKENLKLLTLYDPTVAEFFFGGYPVLVEGDTEYVAFKHAIKAILADPTLCDISPDKLCSIQIIRARGKAPIVSLCKILNHFGVAYAVLHDADTQTIKVTNKKTGEVREQANPAWSMNGLIRSEIDKAPLAGKIRHLASVPNFEVAYLDKEATQDKPYNAVRRMTENPDVLREVITLLATLIEPERPIPAGAVLGRDLASAKIAPSPA